MDRSEFCRLLHIDPEGFETLARRDHLLIVNPGGAGRHDYTVWEVFLNLLVLNFGDRGLDRPRAAAVVDVAAPLLAQRIAEIGRSSEPESDLPSIFVGRLGWQIDAPQPFAPFVGTAGELEAHIDGPEPHARRRAVDIYLTNATLTASVLRARADRLRIDLDNLWDPAVPHPLPEVTRKQMAAWQKAVERVNAKFEAKQKDGK